ncbi:MAG: hypothetical protein WB508_08930 [Aeromicrobium sp.]|uniref:hypothetical protein n=1 Tax=Aeromicrobium sp. TaxID=1871063 RepID=UPI003C3D1028
MVSPAPAVTDLDVDQRREPTTTWLVAQANIAAKTALLIMLVLVLVDPSWGNLEGKAPGPRALTYPMLAFILPVWWLARGRLQPYPWVADLLVTVPCFSDVLGNRLDLYDQIVWFDDWVHFMNTGLLSAAFLLLTRRSSETPGAILARSVAFGLSVSLLWEIGEYAAFITTSSEMPTAYADTLMDLSLGWLGAVTAAVAVIVARRQASLRSEL